jgi:ferrochelatase
LSTPFDAVLLLSFGGPEGPDDVIPFLENVLRGRNVPRERLLEVAEHYQHFGGKSPINDQNRELIAALQSELQAHEIQLPIYWGNRNWHPLLADTVARMQADGIRHALAIATSSFSSYSGCRQYLEDIDRAAAQVGAGAPAIEKLRLYYNHPGFLEAQADRLRVALGQLPIERRSAARLLFTAHSIPLSMSAGCSYVAQLQEASALVAEMVGFDEWQLVYQSRSGPPSQPWLEPDVSDALEQMAQGGNVRDVVLAPIGFLSDHMEVIYDLDTVAQEKAQELGLNLVRAGTVGCHPRFVSGLRELIAERLDPSRPRLSLGAAGPWPDVCPADCCPPPRRG